MKEDETNKLAAPEKAPERFPTLVEAEEMFEKLARITKETAAKAYELFMERGSRLGGQLEDWFHAESEMLRPAPVEVTQTEGEVKVMLAAPGFKPEEIEVSVKDDLLIVSGETKWEEEKKEEDKFYSEFTSNRFMRKLVLPSQVDSEGVDATLKDGLLTLVLKKRAVKDAEKIMVRSA